MTNDAKSKRADSQVAKLSKQAGIEFVQLVNPMEDTVNLQYERLLMIADLVSFAIATTLSREQVIRQPLPTVTSQSQP